MSNLSALFEEWVPDPGHLWEGAYKIPWNEPEFSRRMLLEHLSQEHDLASRREGLIRALVEWIDMRFPDSPSPRVLDVGCGPGLYVKEFLAHGYRCVGIDFSPASVAYARDLTTGRAEIVEGDVREVEFGSGFDGVLMLFGEINVFYPGECRGLLQKMHDALHPGGLLVLEGHTFESIHQLGLAPFTRYRTGPGLQGLFSASPHLCLVENHWMPEQATAVQRFHVLEEADKAPRLYRSTTKAWSNEEYEELLVSAGFADIQQHSDWPVPSADLTVITAVRG